MSSVQARYRANYDQIARDHISYWRETGNNPFQDPSVLKANEDATVALIEKYAPEERMLDAGCGMGDLLMRFPDCERHGVDLCREYVRIALEERRLAVSQCAVEVMPFPDEFFPLIVCTDVLEHVLDLNEVVEELLRVLKPGGILIVRTPNEEALSTNSSPYEFVHLRRFDKPTMFLLFHKIFGCEVLETPIDGDVLHAVVRK